ncbi:MAG: hypothetical protein JW751_24870 [Polyangiaceae bacterium]|nr:hypothetical protein [Polyangiaceae bacterium]
MTFRTVPPLGLLLVVLLLPTACGGGDDSTETGTGGSGGSGGTPGTGGATGGAAADYWPAAYDPAGAPTPADGGYHVAVPNAGQACMASCHDATGVAATKLVFGGTVFRSDGVAPAPNVEVGVKDGTNQYYVYTAANGMYWAMGTTAVNWAAADIRIRNATGELVKLATDARDADCDRCHRTGAAELPGLPLTIAP